jgi:ABC-type nitrate/sulfonate/bicarbonate transport system substrate-binding protein
MLPIVAQQKGFFQAEGLDVQPNYLQTGKVAMDAVVSGDLNFGVIVEPAPPGAALSAAIRRSLWIVCRSGWGITRSPARLRPRAYKTSARVSSACRRNGT